MLATVCLIRTVIYISGSAYHLPLYPNIRISRSWFTTGGAQSLDTDARHPFYSAATVILLPY